MTPKDSAQVIAELTAMNAGLREQIKDLEKALWKRDHPVLRRALSVSDVLRLKRETYAFEGAWAEAFGRPERNGVWFVWGSSGNGKTSFVLQLCKELSRFGRVAYDSLEEGASLTMQNAFVKMGMQDVARRFVLLDREGGQMPFAAAFPSGTRAELIVSFLALLELIKLHSVVIRQGDLFGDILVCLRTSDH